MKLEAKLSDGAVRLEAKFCDGAVRLGAKFRETQIVEVGKEAVIEPLEVGANGAYAAPDGVDGYSPVVVSVPVPDGYIQPEGTLEVTENGTHDVTEFASVDVNVQAGGGEDATEAMKKVIDSIIMNDAGTAKTLESNVTSLRQYALRGTDFVTVNLPNVTTMGTYAFHNCTSLVNIHLPKIKTLSGYDFQNCRKVQVFDFPSLESIGVASFYGCSGMKALVIRSNRVCALKNTGAFTNSSIASGTAYVYVPAAQLSDADETKDYRRATNWSTYAATQFRVLEDYTVDGTITGALDLEKIGG